MRLISFLRKLWACFFTWRVFTVTDQAVAAADVILTQGSSILKDETPGPGNELLAEAVQRLQEMYAKLPIIPQDVVAQAAPETRFFSVAGMPEGEPAARSSSRWNTNAVTAYQAVICHQHGWKTAAIAAMPDHQWRAMMVAKRHSLNPLMVKIDPCQEHYHHLASMRWSQRGGRWRFVCREIAARLYFLYMGWI